MQNDLNAVLRACGKFLVLALAVTLVALIVIYDVCIAGIDFSESTLIEMSQEIILPVCVLLFILLARMKPAMKYTYFLIAGFFACMFFREMDFFFGRLGLPWIVAVLLVAAISIGQCLRDRKAALAGLAEFSRSEGFPVLITGLAILLFFSRLFGMGYLWKHLLAEGYVRSAKIAAEEGIELLGYAIILVGVLFHFVSVLRKKA